MKSGVRQGCPLSGLLFAICVDVLLVRLERLFSENEMARAYADDMAVVIKDYVKSAPALATAVDEFSRISALKLNVKKTVVDALTEIVLKFMK